MISLGSRTCWKNCWTWGLMVVLLVLPFVAASAASRAAAAAPPRPTEPTKSANPAAPRLVEPAPPIAGMAPMAAPADPARPPSLSAEQKSAVVRTARGLLTALWTGGRVEDVSGAALRELAHPVSVTIRRRGAVLGRGQAGGADLFAALREATAAAVAESKSTSAGVARASDLRLELEIAGTMTPIRLRYEAESQTAVLKLSADTLTYLAAGQRGIPAPIVQRLMPLANKSFVDEAALAGRLREVLSREELASYETRLLTYARPAVLERVADDILEQCKRGRLGLCLEHRTPTTVYVGMTFPSEVITDNISPIGFISRTILRAQLPAHLTNRHLRLLLDEGTVRVWSFPTVHLVETAAGDPGHNSVGWWEPFRGHKLVTDADVTSEAVETAVLRLSEHLFIRMRLPQLVYYPSIDGADPSGESPMDRALVAWGLAESSAHYPKRKLLAGSAESVINGLRANVRGLRVPPTPGYDYVFVPGDTEVQLDDDERPIPRVPPKAAPPTKTGPPVSTEKTWRLSVIREPDGQSAHLGTVAVTALAITRLPASKFRETLTGQEPLTVMVDDKPVKIIKLRERLMISVAWMQNRVRADTTTGGDPRSAPARPLTPIEQARLRWEPGSFRSYFPPTRQTVGQDQYSGPALMALAEFHAETGDAKALGYIRAAMVGYRTRFQMDPDWNRAAWQIPAFARTALKTGDAEMSAFVLSLADRLMLHQIRRGGANPAASTLDADQIGSFPPDGDSMFRASGTTALAVLALSEAHAVALRRGDQDRAEAYAGAIRSGSRFLLQLQFKPEELYYVREPGLAAGGMRFDIGDNGIHQSNCALALVALLRAEQALWPTGPR